MKSAVVRDPLRGLIFSNFPDAKPEHQYVISFFKLSLMNGLLTKWEIKTLYSLKPCPLDWFVIIKIFLSWL